MREHAFDHASAWLRIALVVCCAIVAMVAGSVPVSAADGPVLGVSVTVLGQTDVAAGDLLIEPATGVETVLTFSAGQWSGAYYYPQSTHYGRPWVALYGSQSDYPSGTLSFSLNAKPTAKVTLTLTGVGDETGLKDRVSVTINGKIIYLGTAWFKNWDGKTSDANAPWTTVDLLIPSSYFFAGKNTVTVANLKVANNYGKPPYVLLGAARISIPGGGAKIG